MSFLRSTMNTQPCGSMNPTSPLRSAPPGRPAAVSSGLPPSPATPSRAPAPPPPTPPPAPARPAGQAGRRLLGLAPVAGHHLRAVGHDLADLAQRQVLPVVVLDPHDRVRRRGPGGSPPRGGA